MFASFGSGFEDEFDQDASFVSSDHNSSNTDSEHDLKEVEELLYSQVHYMSNTLYTNVNNSESDEIVVTLVGSKCVKSAEFGPGSLEQQGDSAHHLIRNKDDPHQMNIIEKADRKLRCKEANDVTTIMELDSNTVSSSDSVLSENLQSLTAVGSNQSPQSFRVSQQFNSIPVTSTAKKPVYVSSSSSDSSYDAFFFDGGHSSSDSDSAKGDTKINFVCENSSDAKLKKILKSLPDCTWDSNDHDKLNDVSNRLKGSSRYYQMKAFCLNCRANGHLASTCVLPKKLYACLLCGKRGHLARLCSESLCFLCNLSGHSVRDCPNRKWRFERCSRCGISGHPKLACPDLWRQYHLTTDGAKVVKGDEKPNSIKFCYNCAGRGHFGHECDEERMDRRSSISFPFIVKYDIVPGEQSGTTNSSQDKRRSHSNRHSPASVNPSNNSIKKFNQQFKTPDGDLRNVISSKNSQKSNGHMYREGNDDRANPVRRTFQGEQDFPRNSSPQEKKSVHERLLSRREANNDIVVCNKNYASYQTPSGDRQSIKEPYTRDDRTRKTFSGKRKHNSSSVITLDPSHARSSRDNPAGFQSEGVVETPKKKKLGKKDRSCEKLEKVIAEAKSTVLLSSEENLRIKLAKHQAKRKEQKKKRKIREQAKRKMESSSSIAAITQSETSFGSKSPGTQGGQKSVIRTERGFRLN